MKTFIVSQYGYCHLIWMFHSRGVNNKINHLHQRLLQIVCKDSIISFEDLFKRDKFFTIHQRNIQSLAIELFKVKRNLSNNIMYDIYQTRTIKYNLSSQTNFGKNYVNTNKFGINLGRYHALYGAWFRQKLKTLEEWKHSKQNFEIGSLNTVTATYVRLI